MKQFWDERYAEKEFVYGTMPNQFLAEQLLKLKAGSILLPCEGEGRNAVFAANNGWHVTAFDFSNEGLNKANLLAKQNGVSIDYLIGDASVINFENNSFDVIALIYAHFPAAIRASIHKRMFNWLKPGGTLVLEAFNPLQLKNTSGGPKDINMLYTESMLAQDFDTLKIVHSVTHNIVLNEGKFHNGLASVVQFVGKK